VPQTSWLLGILYWASLEIGLSGRDDLALASHRGKSLWTARPDLA
jgi:hypothetical protein